MQSLVSIHLNVRNCNSLSFWSLCIHFYSNSPLPFLTLVLPPVSLWLSCLWHPSPPHPGFRFRAAVWGDSQSRASGPGNSQSSSWGPTGTSIRPGARQQVDFNFCYICSYVLCHRTVHITFSKVYIFIWPYFYICIALKWWSSVEQTINVASPWYFQWQTHSSRQQQQWRFRSLLFGGQLQPAAA